MIYWLSLLRRDWIVIVKQVIRTLFFFRVYFSRLVLPVLWFSSCTIPKQSLNIILEETPIYSKKQWAVVNIPYLKVNSYQPEDSQQTNTILDTVTFGSIVEILRVEVDTSDQMVWAFILWQPEVAQEDTKTNQDKKIQGRAPYNFLYLFSSLKEAQLASRQMTLNSASMYLLDKY